MRPWWQQRFSLSWDGGRARGLPVAYGKFQESGRLLSGSGPKSGWGRGVGSAVAYLLLAPWYKSRFIGLKMVALMALHLILLLALFLSGLLLWRRHAFVDIGRDWPEAWGSCLNPPLQYWWKTLHNPQRVEVCSELVLQASRRGKAAQKRGIAVGEGRAERAPLDGCALAHGSKEGSFAAGVRERELSGVSSWRWSRRKERLPTDGCRMEWVTYSTECSANLNRIADICDMMGISLQVVGLQEWWMGWGGRTRMIREVVQSLPADRLVLSSDADDVLLLPTSACSMERLMEKFSSVGRPVLVGAERYCYPDGERWQEYPNPPRDTPYKYVNGGTFLGFAWAMLDVTGQAYRGDCIDDQREVTRVYLDNTSYVGRPNIEGAREIVTRLSSTLEHPGERHPYLQLDWYNNLLLPLGGAELSEFDFSGYEINGTVKSKLTEGRPCIFHQNGDKKERPKNPVVWPHLIKAIGIDRLRENEGYLKGQKGH